jgi:ribonucleoside-diphosphate reductase alpha chain
MDNKIYWLNKDSRTFLKRGYLIEDETPESRMRDIADGAEKLLGLTGFADKFERYLHAGYYSLSSPIWSNFARERGLPISCFGSYIPDTMEGIFGKLSEVAMMTKAGGGTSGYFGDIRSRGSAISSGGTSTGAVHFMELYDKTMNVVSQGNVRRGSFAAYLPIDHGDIEEFLQIKGDGNSIQDMSIGVSVSDEWMRSMIDGDKQKRKIWGLVIKKRFESGYPYLFFSDNANNAAPQIYKDKGLMINNSNLCFAGDTLIEISTKEDGSDATWVQLVDFTYNFNLGIWEKIYTRSWNSTSKTFVWAEVSNAAQTGEVDELIVIETPDGNVIECTPEHKILTKNRGWVEAQNLEENDELITMKNSM